MKNKVQKVIDVKDLQDWRTPVGEEYKIVKGFLLAQTKSDVKSEPYMNVFIWLAVLIGAILFVQFGEFFLIAIKSVETVLDVLDVLLMAGMSLFGFLIAVLAGSGMYKHRKGNYAKKAYQNVQMDKFCVHDVKIASIECHHNQDGPDYYYAYIEDAYGNQCIDINSEGAGYFTFHYWNKYETGDGLLVKLLRHETREQYIVLPGKVVSPSTWEKYLKFYQKNHINGTIGKRNADASEAVSVKDMIDTNEFLEKSVVEICELEKIMHLDEMHYKTVQTALEAWIRKEKRKEKRGNLFFVLAAIACFIAVIVVFFVQMYEYFTDENGALFYTVTMIILYSVVFIALAVGAILALSKRLVNQEGTRLEKLVRKSAFQIYEVRLIETRGKKVSKPRLQRDAAVITDKKGRRCVDALDESCRKYFDYYGSTIDKASEAFLIEVPMSKLEDKEDVSFRKCLVVR